MKVYVRNQKKYWFGEVSEMWALNGDIYTKSQGEIRLLGEYTSTTRCIEIIDKFQLFLANYSLSNPSYPIMAIFEMPKE